MPGPLEGVRVVDFSRVLAGPLCARTLLELGADVTKIEPPSPDVARFSAPSLTGMSGYYAQQNAGKRNISIDLNKDGAREIALRLCDQADVVVENFRAGTLASFGLGYDVLSERNPRLIYASVTGYGQAGPWRSRSAYAPTVQAEAGFTANSARHYGTALTQASTDSLSHGDVYTGLEAAIAILAALHRRQSTGMGQHIDIAMAATLLSINERAHLDLGEDDAGDEPAVLGATESPFFEGPDGEHFTVATNMVWSGTFPSWLRAMRRPDLGKDPRFATSSARRQNFAALHAIIQSWIYTFPDKAALDAQLDEAKIAFGEVRTLGELAETDWAKRWGAVREVSNRYGGVYRIPGAPWIFSSDALPERGAPAFRGEDNLTIARSLGYSDEEIRELIATKALVADRAADGRRD